MFFDFKKLETFLTEAVEHYATSAPTVSRYCDELYIRATTGEGRPVTLDELMRVQWLRVDGDQFMQANHAANAIYKLMDGLGMDTTGHAGF